MRRLKKFGLFLTMAGISAFSGNASSLPTQEPEAATEPEAVYVVGSFNDWKLPDGNNLNGAIQLTGEDTALYPGPVYSTDVPVTFPEGETQFKIYVVGHDRDNSFYISRNKAVQQEYQTLYMPYGNTDLSGDRITGAHYSAYAYSDKEADQSTPLVLRNWNGKPLSITIDPYGGWTRGEYYQINLYSKEAPELPEDLNIPPTLNIIVKEPGKEPKLCDEQYLYMRDINPEGEEFEILYTTENSTNPAPENCFGLIEPATINIENNNGTDNPSALLRNGVAMNFKRGSTIPIKISLCKGIDYVMIAHTCEPTNEYITTTVNAYTLPYSSKDVYVVGSFNDWKLPDGDNLNGAVRLTKDWENNQGHTYNTATPVVFPEGDVQFKVYVKGKDSKDSFYISRDKADQQQYQTLYKHTEIFDESGRPILTSGANAYYSGYAYDNKDANESTPLLLKDWNGKTLSIEVYPLTEWSQEKAYSVRLTSDEAPELPEELNIPDILNTIVKEPGKEPQLFHGQYLTLRDINPSGEELEILYTIEDSTNPAPENCFGLIEPATIQIKPSTINTDEEDYSSRFWTNEGSMNFRRGSTIPIRISLCEGIGLVRIFQDCCKNNEYIKTQVFAYPLSNPSVPEVFVVGSFNDWKLPDGNNLNGAIRLERSLISPNRYVTDESVSFPSGETQFKIYVVDKENNESFYISRNASTNQAFQTLFHIKGYIEPSAARFEGYSYSDEEGTPFVLKDWNGKKISFELFPTEHNNITLEKDKHFWFILTSNEAPEIESFPVYEIVRVAGKEPETSIHNNIDMDIDPEEETELEILYTTECSINPDPANCLGLIEPVTLYLDCPTISPNERTEVRGGMNFQRGSTTPIKVKLAKGIDRISVSFRPQLDMSFILTVVDGYSSTAGVDIIEEDRNDADFSVNGLTVTAVEGTALEVYSLTGISIGAGNEVTVPSAGFYIIRTSDKAVKVKL